MSNRKNNSPGAKSGWIAGLRDGIRRHHVPIFAAGVAFFAFVALVPALAATVSITSLVSDTDTLVTETEAALENAPVETKEFLVAQIRSIAETDGAGVGIAAVVGTLLALFSASAAVSHLMTALNVVFGRDESRNFVSKRLTAIVLLLGAVVTIAAAVMLMAVVPALLTEWSGGAFVKSLVVVGRLFGLFALLVVGLSALYRFGPAAEQRESYELVPGGRQRLMTRGAVWGAVLIASMSWLFGRFVQTFGSYNETYGALAGIIVVLLWLQLLAVAVLIGAEIDSWRASERVRVARADVGLPDVGRR